MEKSRKAELTILKLMALEVQKEELLSEMTWKAINNSTIQLKIAGRILSENDPARKTILTTKMKIIRVGDLSSDNDLLVLSDWDSTEFGPLAGVGFGFRRYGLKDSLLESIRKIFSEYKENMKGYDFWILAGTSAWQNDNRILRYKKLKGILESWGFNIPTKPPYREVLVESTKGIKFFGATPLPELFLPSAIIGLCEYGGVYFAVLPAESKIDDVLQVGWDGRITNDLSLVSAIKKLEGILITRFGYFDDPDVGFLALGSPEVVDLLMPVRGE